MNTAKLLEIHGESIINKVCTTGGISRIGVDYVSNNFPIKELSDELLNRMQNVKEQYGGFYG